MTRAAWLAIAVGVTGMGSEPVMAQEPGCVTAASPASLAGRASPLDSLSFAVAGQPVKVCYGRPSARGRTMIGGTAVPYGKVWRTGANEPTMIHTPVPLSIAGVPVDPGTYSIYSVPNESEWEIIVNRSYSQWGQEGQYTPEVQAQEAGRGRVAPKLVADHAESFAIAFQSGNLVFRWERTAVEIPITAR